MTCCCKKTKSFSFSCPISLIDLHSRTAVSLPSPPVSAGHLEVVQFLSAAGATADVRQSSRSGNSPLMWAALNGHAHVVDFLLEVGAVHGAPRLRLSLPCSQVYTSRGAWVLASKTPHELYVWVCV